MNKLSLEKTKIVAGGITTTLGVTPINNPIANTNISWPGNDINPDRNNSHGDDYNGNPGESDSSPPTSGGSGSSFVPPGDTAAPLDDNGNAA